MLKLKDLLAHLTRPEVSALVLNSGQRPRVRLGASLEPIDSSDMTSDGLVRLLFAAGGSRYLDQLGPRPTTWTTRADPVGPVVISATQHGVSLEATFTLPGRVDRVPEPRRERSEKPAVRDPRIDDTLPPPRHSREARGDARPRRDPRSEQESIRPHAPASLDETEERDRIRHISIAPKAEEAEAKRGRDEEERKQSDERERKKRDEQDRARRDEEAAFRKLEEEAEKNLEREARQKREAEAHRLGEIRRKQAAEARKKSEPAGAKARRSSSAAPKKTRHSRSQAKASMQLDLKKPAVTPSAGSAIELPEQGRQRSSRREPGPYGKELERLLSEARKANASDLHIVAGRPPRFRVGGMLIAAGSMLTAGMVESMLLDRVPPALAERLRRHGSCDFAVTLPREGRFRFNVSLQRTGYKGSIRIVADAVPTLEGLGLPLELARALDHHQGLIVIAGPTGHGKTSTLAALVDVLNEKRAAHIITVEDPVEYIHPRKKAVISQREVGSSARSFSSALKGSLRQDPDVIVVGELRDLETVRMALSASETGHLVIGTMNTPSAARTIDRLIDLFPPADQAQVRTTLAGGLRLIVSQRLVPDPERTRMHVACEVLPGSVPLWNLIRDSKTYQIPSLQQRGKATGVLRLEDSLADLVRAQKVALADAQAVCEAPEELAVMISGKRPARGATLDQEVRPHTPDGPSAGAPGLLERAGSFFRRGGS